MAQDPAHHIEPQGDPFLAASGPARLALMPEHVTVTLDVTRMQPMQLLLVELNGLLEYLMLGQAVGDQYQAPTTEEAARRLDGAMLRFVAGMDEATGDDDGS